jgi:hypothetical protein
MQVYAFTSPKDRNAFLLYVNQQSKLHSKTPFINVNGLKIEIEEQDIEFISILDNEYGKYRS